jgi:hypothetical protein
MENVHRTDYLHGLSNVEQRSRIAVENARGVSGFELLNVDKKVREGVKK